MKRRGAAIRRLLLPGSLRNQLLTRSLFLLAALLMLVGSVQYFWMQSFVYDQKAEAMMLQLRSLPRDIGERLRTDSNDVLEYRNGPPMHRGMRLPLLLLADTSLAYYDSNGVYADLSSDQGITSPRLPQDVYTPLLGSSQKELGDTRYLIAEDARGREQLLVFLHIDTKGGMHADGVLQLGAETGPLHAMLLRQLMTFAVLALLALFAGLALYLPIIRRTLRPLSRIIEAVGRTNAGNLNDRIDANQGQVEVDRLAASYNEMLRRLAHSFDAEREAKERMGRFVADASHELRTPLTSILGFLEVLLRGAADKPEQLYPALRSMHGESKRIQKLVEDLLFLAKLDRVPSLQLAALPLDELLLEMEPQLRVLAGHRTVRLEIEGGIEARCDRDRTKQAVLNLFDNAVQHTDPRTGLIELALRRPDDRSAALSIRDNGTGIEAQHLPYLFDRFYRSDPARSRAHGGAGLGLAITRSIADAQAWTIGVESQPGQGSTFTLTIPTL